MSLIDGRDLHAKKHPTAEQREARRGAAAAPARNEKSVSAGRALHDNHGKFAPDYAQGA